jgi:PPOX class probable F420-dependent enzyme
MTPTTELTAVEVPELARPLFERKNFAHVATLLEGGNPTVSPVWIELDGHTPVFNTAEGRAKHRDLERDPRVALSIHDQDDPYHSVIVRGRAELTTEGADEHIDKLARKYLGADEYPFRQEGEVRVIVRVTPESISHTPPRED